MHWEPGPFRRGRGELKGKWGNLMKAILIRSQNCPVLIDGPRYGHLALKPAAGAERRKMLSLPSFSLQ